MRVMRGYQAAREALLERRPLEDTPLPEAVSLGMKGAFGVELSPQEAVGRILADVRKQGDSALFFYTHSLDHAPIQRLDVTPEEAQSAYESTPSDLLASLELAAARIKEFHRAHRPATQVDFLEGTGQIVRPLDRVGLYAPGGRASYPSTVLMTAIPAKVAGVPEVILATPPDRQGNVNPLILAATKIAGVDRVFKIGGAQAIAAMAYGTATVPRVDKICGPGNLFVVLAKRAVFGIVGIDGLHGPSEAIILADATADPDLCAADLLAQAEHDELASVLLITTAEDLIPQVEAAMEEHLKTLSRPATIRGALERFGLMVLVEDLRKGVDLVNLFAPEHLSLMVQDPWSLVGSIRHAGALFLGPHSCAALGDYVAGPSHVMPTGGTARFSSPLRVEDFQKVISLVALDQATAAAIGPAAAALARAEGLTAHARAIQVRGDRSSVGQ